MTSQQIMCEALGALCQLFGGRECDHCSWIKRCETSCADTSACEFCGDIVNTIDRRELPGPRDYWESVDVAFQELKEDGAGL